MNDEIILEYQLASTWKRSWAFAIDQLLLSLLLSIILFSYVRPDMGFDEIMALTQRFIGEYYLLCIAYQTLFTLMYGASLGKMAMKIRVIELAHPQGHPQFWSALNRAVFRIVSEIVLYLGFIWAFFDPFRRSWHDLSAKTLVIDA